MNLKITKSNPNSKKIFLLTPLFLASISIFIASHQEGVPFDTSIFIFQDKVFHFIAYFIYGITIQLFLSYFNLENKKYILLTILIGSLFGASDEFHQSFIPHRTIEFFDWVADTLGVTASLSIRTPLFKLINKIFNK